MGAQGKKITSPDGAEIYYETYPGGAGKPVLFFVHGVGADLDAWQFEREPLVRAGYGAVALDLRGHGYSSHPRAAARYALERMGGDIESVIKAERLARPVLVGHSGGAVLAAHFALARQAELGGLVLICGSYGPPSYARRALPRAAVRAVLAALSLISPSPTRGWHSPYPPGKHHKEIEMWGLLRTIYHNSLRSYLSVSKGLVELDMESRLAELRLPTLLVAAERDGIYPLAISKRMHELIAGSQLAVVPGANHVLPLNRPAETAEHVKNFLTDFSSAGFISM